MHGAESACSWELRNVLGNRTARPSLDQLGPRDSAHLPPQPASSPMGASVRDWMEPVVRLILTYWCAGSSRRMRKGIDGVGGGYNVSQDGGTSRTGRIVTNELASGESAKSSGLASGAPSCFTSKRLPLITAHKPLGGGDRDFPNSSGKSNSRSEWPVPIVVAGCGSVCAFCCVTSPSAF